MPKTKTLEQESTLQLAATVVVIEFISGFTQGFYEPLIPNFSAALGVNASEVTLFNTIPTLVAAILVPILTKLGDIRGYRKILRIVITTIFLATATIWLGVALNSWALILFGRFLNGPIAVWLPLHIALVHSKMIGVGARKAVSAIVALLAFGTVIGTASSGFIFNALGSLTVSTGIPPFLVLVAVVLVWFVMPEFVSGAKNDLDYPGFAGLGIIMVITMVGFVEIVAGGTDTLIGAAALIVAAVIAVFWYRYEHRLSAVSSRGSVGSPDTVSAGAGAESTKNKNQKTKNYDVISAGANAEGAGGNSSARGTGVRIPAINTVMVFSKNLGPLYLVTIAYGCVFYGFLSPISTYLAADPAEVGFGFGFDAALVSISETAILLTTALAAVITSPLLAKLKSKWTIIAGGILAIASFLDLALVAGNSLGKLIAFIALSGLGLGIISAATPIIIPEIVPTGEKGLATGLFNSCQTLGGALGSGLFLALLLTGATNSGDVTVIGYNTVWFTCAGLLASGVLVFGLLYQENIEQRIKNKEQGVKNDD